MKMFEQDYKDLLVKAMNGDKCPNRTGVDTFKLFNAVLNIDLSEGFPIITSKKIFFDKAKAEFEWMWSGDTNIKYLNDHGVKWWDSWADENGEVGHIYGHQIRNFNNSYDQLEVLPQLIKEWSRRAIITFWDPSDLKNQSLPSCYTQFTFVRTETHLNMSMDMRSSDLYLGLPYDIIIGALFLTRVSLLTNLKPGILGMSLKDAHIYENHIDQIKEYINKPMYILPTLSLYKFPYHKEAWIPQEVTLENYNCEPYISAPLNK